MQHRDFEPEHDLEPRELARAAVLELRLQIRRQPYSTLAAAGVLGVLLGAGWLAAGAALALREGARWAASEGLRHIAGAPSPAAFSRERAASSRPSGPH